MPAPVIDPESGVLAYPQWLPWEHNFSATESPTSWAIASGTIPTGMTFQPTNTSVIGEADTEVITVTDHGFLDGTLVMFTALTGGTGLSINTNYYVRDKTTHTFKLALTHNGAVVAFSTDITNGTLIRPGHLTGAAILPGFSNIRLTATNGSGTSPEVLFTIAIEPAAASPDAHSDIVFDLTTGHIIPQLTSELELTPPDPEEEPPLFVKEGDDWIGRFITIKGGTVIDLSPSAMRIAVKEFEPEGEVVLSSDFIQVGEGASSSLLIYAQFSGAALASVLSGYEKDAGTFVDVLAEIELTYPNTTGVGPDDLVKTSRTFRIRVERDLADN